MAVRLKPISEAIDEVVQYIKDRAEGKITSLRWGKKKLDTSLLDGTEWNSTITLGGRPSVGKSTVADVLVDGAFENNLDADGNPDFDLLDMNWELASKVILLRRLSSKVKNTYKYVISAQGNKVSPAEVKEMENILRNTYGRLPISFCEEPLSVKEFEEVVEEYCIAHPGRKVLVRVDHTLLTKMSSAYRGNQVAMLLDLLMTANRLKKRLPLIFMFISQINREFEERQEDGTDRAFPRQGDVFGGDAAAMFSETMILLNKPSKYGIRQYGRRGGEIEPIEPDDLYFHIVKNRNSDADLMIRYKENFKEMNIKEW